MILTLEIVTDSSAADGATMIDTIHSQINLPMTAERTFEIGVQVGSIQKTEDGWLLEKTGVTFPDTEGGRINCGVAAAMGEDVD